MRDVTVQLPAGVEDGARLRLPIPGAELVAVVRATSHRYFERKGKDIALRLPLTISEATLGGIVSVPTLTGALAVRIPPGSRHGRTLRARGHGIPHTEGPGDLLMTIEIDIPPALNEAQRAALEAYAAVTASPRKHFETAVDEHPTH
jgi:molecular chaperone DnaJ